MSETYYEYNQKYNPSLIEHYVSRMLMRMYVGSAPTLMQVSDRYGAVAYMRSASDILCSHFDFAKKERPSDSTLNQWAMAVKSEYPWLKVTELMHFAYLLRFGDYDRHLSKPNPNSLLKAVKQFVDGDYKKYSSEFREKQRREEEELARIRQRQAYESDKPNLDMIKQQIAEAFSEENTERHRRWRQEPWGTAICRAYFVDKTLKTCPGDMTDKERYDWSVRNKSYVEAFPNLMYVDNRPQREKRKDYQNMRPTNPKPIKFD